MKKLCCFSIIALLTIALICGCNMINDPRVIYSPHEDVTSSEDEVSCSLEAESIQDSRGNFLNMRLGGKEAIFTGGQPLILDNAPFFEGGIVFVPLVEIMEIFNSEAQFSYEEGSCIINFKHEELGRDYTRNYCIWLDENYALNIDSGEYETFQYINTVASPLLRGETIYVPDFYFNYFFYGYAQHDLDTGWLTISNFYDGGAMAGFLLDSDFALLADSVRSRFASTGEVEYIDGGALKQEIFSDSDIELTIRTGEKRYMKKEGVKEEIHRITLITDKYCTPRGLRVGDSSERCYLLYGKEPGIRGGIILDVTMPGILEVEINNGIVTKISCHSTD